jgi:hypothetical protein
MGGVGWGGQYLVDPGAKRERWLRPKSAARALVVGGDSNEFSSINCPELWESLREEGVPVQDDPSVFRSPSPPPYPCACKEEVACECAWDGRGCL